jgi:hypothetical protein
MRGLTRNTGTSMTKVMGGLLETNWQKTAGSRSQKEEEVRRSSTFAAGNRSEKLKELATGRKVFAMLSRDSRVWGQGAK